MPKAKQILGSGENAHNWSAEDFAKAGVSQADALIAELNKPISSNTIKQ